MDIRKRTRLLTTILICAVAAACGAPGQKAATTGEIMAQPPDRPDPERSYLFYLHGRIIEEEGLRPTHPRFGVYEYQEILERFAEHGLVVISERRAAGTKPAEYAETVAHQVEQLLNAGVPPSQITVVGFSKGGIIAILTASAVGSDHVRFVFLASCGDWIAQIPDLEVRGQVLSLYEASDDLATSCRTLLEAHPASLREIRLELGGGHGAFYRPEPKWIDPVTDWATRDEVAP